MILYFKLSKFELLTFHIFDDVKKVCCSSPIFGLLDGNGPLTSTGIESLLYIKSKNFTDSDPDLPDVEILQSWATIAFDLGFYLLRNLKSM